MQKKIKVYGDGNWIQNSELSSFDEADIVVMPGGGDFNPALYGHKPVATRYWSKETDTKQLDIINKAIKTGKLVFGICRGLN